MRRQSSLLVGTLLGVYLLFGQDPAGQVLPHAHAAPPRQYDLECLASCCSEIGGLWLSHEAWEQVEDKKGRVWIGTRADAGCVVSRGEQCEAYYSGDYSVEAQAADGQVLASLSFPGAFEREGEESRMSPFVLPLPASPGIAQIVFKHGGQGIHTLPRSVHSPVVEITSPSAGQVLTGRHTVTWQASDGDGDALSYALLYSPDEGRSWTVLATHGMNTAAATSPGSFVVFDKPPTVSIVAPPEPALPTGLDPLVGLLRASLCGWAVVVGGFLAVVLFARRRPFARWLLVVLAGAALVLTSSSCLLGLSVLSGGERTVATLEPAPGPTSVAGLPTFSPEPPGVSVPAPTSPPPSSTPPPTATQPPSPLVPSPTIPTPGPAIALPTVWRVETVDTGTHVGLYSSLALDSAGRPHVSYSAYSQPTGGPDYDLRYARFDGIAWNVETVDSAGSAGWFTSLALDADDRPRVSYYAMDDQDVRVALHDGTGWQVATLDDAGDTGWYTSLALDASGDLHVSCYQTGACVDDTSCNLIYLSFDGSWHGGRLHYSTGTVGEYSSLAIDSGDHPHISYYDRSNGNLRYLHHDGSSWSTWEIVDSDGDVGADTSLALDAKDRPHIAYLDVGNLDLKYAHFDGTDWHVETVDSAGDVGHSASIALDAAGRPHIAYYDPDNDSLKYALHDGSAWQIGTVDTIGGVVGWEGVSLALDGADRPHISYYTAGGLKHAYAPPP